MNRASTLLATGSILVILAVFLTVGIYLLQEISQSQHDAWRDQVVEEARLAGAAVESAAGAGDDLEQLLSGLGAEREVATAVVDANGDVVAGEPIGDESELASEPDVESALAGESGEVDRLDPETGVEYRSVAVPVTLGEGQRGALLWSVPLADAPGLWNALTLTAAGALALAALGIMIASLLMPRIILQPLAELAAVARRVARGDLDARADTDTYEEVAEIAAAFNETTDDLREQLATIDFERARLEAIVEHLNDGILIVDPRGAVQSINRAAEELLRIDRERALVRSYTEVVRDHELVDLVRESQALYQPDQPLPTRFIELGQPRRSIQAFAYPIAQGESGLVIVILRDITELRRTETVRRDFVANVSHELRTPIASLKALVETLLDGALEDREAARDFLSRMEIEVDDLARLVEELLELSRAESRRIELNRIPADLGRLAQRVVARLRTQAEPDRVTIDISVDEGAPPGYVDPDRTEQVLVNLLHNAIKFSPSGGAVRVSVRPHGAELMVSVTDSGPGIPTEELERVFERFYKSDRSRSESGSGLGLAIARHLVQLHDGRIWAESGRRGGTTITFTVPAANENPGGDPGNE